MGEQSAFIERIINNVWNLISLAPYPRPFKKNRASWLYRTASTVCLCCVSALEG